jgi:HAD superfamily hydrolase (TIGR01509 family)
MTGVPPSDTSLRQIISRTRHLLLDFDGPVCSVFAGISAATVADQLRRRLTAAGIALPTEAGSVSDPLELFRIIAASNVSAGERAQRELTALEVQAVATARPADGAAELIVAAHRSGRVTAIVSNNSGQAITAYLHAHGLARYVSVVIGRDDPDPAHMKPSPHRVREAVRALRAAPAHCALIGDSVSDVTAAHAAGVPAIGYANKPGKGERLTQAGADAVIMRLASLVDALTAEAVTV